MFYRCAYTLSSLAPSMVLVYFTNKYGAVAVPVIGGLVAWGMWLATGSVGF